MNTGNIVIGDRIRVTDASAGAALAGKEGFVESIHDGFLYGTWGKAYPVLVRNAEKLNPQPRCRITESPCTYKKYALAFDTEDEANRAFEITWKKAATYHIPEYGIKHSTALHVTCTHESLLDLIDEIDWALR